MILGFIIGMAIGLQIGLWCGKSVMERMYKTIIESYKRDEKFWFEEYLKMLDWYQQMSSMYFKEAIKNTDK